ncbi:MAG: 3-deoxy-D-manno-octulosonic acid transferase [Deltaproteobacteria bacterium]|nr:3-deoxy-D-manno-octulosonic acid transferase [Deltaproteobacteria bacterium]
MFWLVYDALWSLVLIPAVPLILLSRNKRLAQRFAVTVPSAMEKEGNIWVHGLSVGEVMSAVPLVKAMASAFPSKGIVFTATTRMGMKVAQKELQEVADRLYLMPLDAWWSVRRFVRRIKPGVFLLVETDVWPGLLSYLKRLGIKSILVNGRISPRTYRSYRRASWLIRRMYEPLDSCFMQSDLDRDRLLAVGVNPEKVKAIGNIKFDRDIQPMELEERAKWFNLLGLSAADPVWVAGSTHRGEEALILKAFWEIRKFFPSLRLILAPRDIARADELVQLIHARGLNGVKRSGISDKAVQDDVLVLDTYGELDRIYGLGWISFVGGSLVPVGGHNLLEPAGQGSPVLFGPYTHNFVFMSSAILNAGGGIRVTDVPSLRDTVMRLLSETDRRLRMGRAAMRFVETNRGAIKRVIAWGTANIPKSEAK